MSIDTASVERPSENPAERAVTTPAAAGWEQGLAPAAAPDRAAGVRRHADADAVRRVLAGDTEAFAALVRRHQDALYRYARGMGIEHDTALDLLQDALVKAYVNLRHCRDPERFLSWLFRIFRNTALDWFKDRRRGDVGLSEVADTPAAPDALDFAERQALRATLGDALASLPAILREAFLLRHQLDQSYEEIAAALGISLSAAKMRVMRAREALREALGPDVTGAPAGSS
jgi:RNA polymerase sigma factor (sigma-70 family)